MPASPSALQAAIVARLINDAALTAVLGAPRIHDVVPQPPTFPYVVLRDFKTTPSDTSLSPADDHAIVFHTYSKAEGRLETHAILAAVRAALDDALMTLVGHRLVRLTVVSTESRRDGALVQGIVRLRALTEPL
jgi:hypothetical protein